MPPLVTSTPPSLATLDPWLWTVRYSGSGTPCPIPLVEGEGANCQRWAYEVVGQCGSVVGPLRSDELWADRSFTTPALVPAPLDLVLFNHGPNSFGAHIGVWTEFGVAHLCREVGVPVIWPLDEFERRPRYAWLLGAKRPRFLGAAQ